MQVCVSNTTQNLALNNFCKDVMQDELGIKKLKGIFKPEII